MKVKPNHFASMRETKKIKRGDTEYTVRANRDRFFFPDEWMAFYDRLSKKQQITFNFLINTGARIMEVQHIKVADCDLDRCNIVLRVTKRVVNRPGKNQTGQRRIRVISISTKFAKYIRKIVSDYSLKPEDTFPILSTPAANIAMKKALKEAGILDWDMFSLHNCRKTLETWLIALGIDSFKIVKHFGHNVAIAIKHYVAPDIFQWEDRKEMREIIGDLYANTSVR